MRAMPAWRSRSRRGVVRRLAGATRAALVFLVVVFTITTVPGVRTEAGFEVVADGWLQGTGYVAAATLAVLRTLVARGDRWLWAGVAAALCARAFGFVTYLVIVRPRNPAQVPSIADAGWLAMYALLLVALVGFARSSFPRLSVPLALDALVGLLATAGIAVALVWGTLERTARSGTPDVSLATDLAYPVLDAMLLLSLAGVLLAFGWRPPPAVTALTVGTAGFALTDVVFLYLSTTGSYRPGTPLAALSLVSTATIAIGAWLPNNRRVPARGDLPAVALPGLFALVCLALLVYAGVRRVAPLSVPLTGAAAAVAVVRTALSFQLVRSVAQRRRDARIDDLTRLPNRQAFTEALSTALKGRPDSRGLALLVADIDDFKAVNDALGHDSGDLLIGRLAPRMQQVLRADDLLARTGGDEFGVLLEDADATRAVQVAERLRAGLRRPLALDGRPVEVSASVGISVFPGDGREPGSLLRRADLAMYDAKATRAGHSVFRLQHELDSRGRLETASRLRDAVAAELVLHYQPQVSLLTGHVVAVEALVRWDHPDDGVVLPAAFLPQVESAGLMGRLTSVVLERAVAQAAAWRAAGTPLRVAVNLSVTSLLDVGLPHEVAGVLGRHDLPAGDLEVELTEDLFVADPQRVRTAIDALLDLGVRLQVDDYGTGYSSLGYLRDLTEIRGLKLDRSFVAALDVEPRSQAIVESTVALARRLGLSVVAEGVERPAVRDRLAALGCELAQGYLFCPPVPPDRLPLGVVDSARAEPR